jgi:two-component system sensor histidine kinase TctE
MGSREGPAAAAAATAGAATGTRKASAHPVMPTTKPLPSPSTSPALAPTQPPVHALRQQSSLFGDILDWMLAPLLLLWPMSLALTWAVAQTIANRPYDRELQDAATFLARHAVQQLSVDNRQPNAMRSDLERVATGLLRANDPDELFFQVLGHRGEFVAGEEVLTVPVDERPPPLKVVFRDDVIGDEPVRVAFVRLPPRAPGGVDQPGGDGALVQVAETLLKRSALTTEIIKGVILPQFLILPLAVLLVWLALSRGIRPLAELQQRIRRRESNDLSPISERGVPDEVAPLVDAINDLLLRLDRSMATQRHFLADAAHQLKTPLAGLRMQAELAAREIDSGATDPAAMKHSLGPMALAAQRAAHMVNQLLAMARAEDTRLALRLQPVDLAALAREVVRDFVPQAMEAGIDLGYEGPAPAPAPASVPGPDRATGSVAALAPPPETGPVAAVDGRNTRVAAEPVLAGELLRNLVDNALRYTPRGGSVTARVLPDPFGQVVVLQVEDTGPGIPAAERERVFQPFYRVLGTQVEGSGLGLAIVLEIAQAHGATLTLDDARPGSSEPGALFTLRFPGAAAGTARAVSAAGEQPKAGAANARPGRGKRLPAGAAAWTSPSGP